MNKRMFTLLSLLLVAVFAVSACGTAAQPTIGQIQTAIGQTQAAFTPTLTATELATFAPTVTLTPTNTPDPNRKAVTDACSQQPMIVGLYLVPLTITVNGQYYDCENNPTPEQTVLVEQEAYLLTKGFDLCQQSQQVDGSTVNYKMLLVNQDVGINCNDMAHGNNIVSILKPASQLRRGCYYVYANPSYKGGFFTKTTKFPDELIWNPNATEYQYGGMNYAWSDGIELSVDQAQPYGAPYDCGSIPTAEVYITPSLTATPKP